MTDRDAIWDRQGAFAFGVLSIIIFAFLLNGLRKGEIQFPVRLATRSYRRKDEPARFWFAAALHAVMGTALAIAAFNPPQR